LESISEAGEKTNFTRTEQQIKSESEDQIVIRHHKSLTGPNYRMERVLSGSYYEKDLKLLSKCQEVEVVSLYKKLKLFLDLDKK
jgi:hypothetical protein